MTIISTSVPDVTITENGLTVPEISDVLSGRIADLVTALGGKASDSLTSPQGQIAMSDSAIISQVYDKLSVLFSQINPDYAQGRFQDGIGRIYFMDRIAGSGTVVTARCYGAVGTELQPGITAQDNSGYIYQSSALATIGSSGYVDVEFTNQTTGPIPCAAGDLNQIYRAVNGWDSILNLTAGSVGSDEESRIAFETRRKDSVYRNSRSQDGSVRAALLGTDGVLDAYVWSNRTGTAIEKGTTSFSVLPHSTYVCVYGGSSEDIAEAIFNTYNPGANLNGDSTYTLYDTNYAQPYPEYEMQWQTAKATPVYVKVTIDAGLNPPSDIVAKTKAMVQTVFSGGYDGIDKARIGGLINGGKYYAPIISIDPSSVGVNNVSLSFDGTTFTPSITSGIDQIPTIEADNIAVTLS